MGRVHHACPACADAWPGSFSASPQEQAQERAWEAYQRAKKRRDKLDEEAREAYAAYEAKRAKADAAFQATRKAFSSWEEAFDAARTASSEDRPNG
jgi:hypothetical protein